MPYIGNTVQNQGFTPAIDYFSGNGVTVTFTLSRPIASVAQVICAIDNVIQNPSSAFTVSGNSITFTSAPLAGTNNIWVEYTSLITTYNAISQSPSVIGDLTASGGYLAVGSFGNSFIDGTIVDYTTGNGRITVGPADGLTIYNGGTAARSALLTLNTNGALGVGTSPSYGTAGQFLQSQGSGAPPQWVALSTPSVNYLVVAGGGGSGTGGGGAGGFTTGTLSVGSGSALTVTVGAGGAGSSSFGGSGTNSVFSSITAVGGGGGSANSSNGASGGSGGGGSGGWSPAATSGGSGTSGQGNSGGNGAGSSGSYANGGGGGGASAGGGSSSSGGAGAGGAGTASSISGSSVTYAGGGGGASYFGGGTGAGAGGAGGGGAGYNGTSGAGTNGTVNTGGGGGGAYGSVGAAGGSGIVIISYLSSYKLATATGTYSQTTSGGNYIFTFTGSGTITF